MRWVSGITGTELLSDVQVRGEDPQDPAPDPDWQTEARIAADFGLLVLTGAGNDQTVTRTQFGDAWAATFDPTDPVARVHDRWPLPGPAEFEVEFFPLTERPTFPVFALTGPTVASIRQGGWNLDLGFGEPGPNPVTQVEMRSTLRDGTSVSVQTATGERWGLPALRVSDLSRHVVITERLLAAGVAWPDSAQRFGSRLCAQAAGKSRGDEFDQHGVQPVDQLGAGANHVIAVLGHRPQRRERRIDLDSVQCRCRPGCDTHRQCVGLVALAAVTDGQQSHAASQLGRNVDDGDVVLTQPLGQRRS